jgi:hypothetical protein
MSYNSPFTGNVVQPTDVSYRSITLSANLQLEWPINGTSTNDAAARIMEVTATTTSLQLWMPPANQASVGQDAMIRNTGANTFVVYDYAGAHTIISIPAGEARYIYITANPDESGTWGIIAFGIGSSGADAATLAGYGLTAIGATLNQSQPVTTFSSDYTALTSDRASTYVWTGGAGTLTLSLAGSLAGNLGNNWFMSVRNGGSGTLTVQTTSSQLFNGSTSVILQVGDSCIICSSGTAFYSVGLGRSTQFNFTQLTKVVSTGTYTLTATEAANVIQKYTGTVTGTVTVILPKTIQVYYITNQTSGAYDIVFTTNTSGAATAQVPAGQQVILLCDSANLLNASTIAAGASTLTLSNGSPGAPALNFASEGNTGIYRAASGEFNTAIGGSLVSTLSIGGLAIVGTGNFTGGVAGGTFP